MACMKIILILSAVFYHMEGGATIKIPRFVNDSSVSSDAKFFWNWKSKPHNSVVVVANLSAENDTERSSKKIGPDSLSSDKDKTEMFVNQYHVTEPDIENIQTRHIPDTFSLGSFLPSLKLPSLLEKKTIILTTTLLQKKTRYNTVFPSCLLLQNVQSVCDGVLKTVLPTKMKPTADIWHLKKTALIESVGENEDSERFIRPSFMASVKPTSTAILELDQKDSTRKEIFSSEWNIEDNQKSENADNLAKATPILSAKDGSIRSEADDGGRLASFFEPRVQFVTKYLTITATENRLDTAHTATVIAENCLPADLHVPLCSSYPFPGEPIGPFIVQPLSPYSQEDSQRLEEVDLTVDDLMKRTVDKMRTQMRNLVVDDIRRLTDEGGRAPQLFRRVALPESGSPIHIRANRSVRNGSHPLPAL